jgi:D-alanyl-D-alanine carboxypeptidase/D-alanyl-D-alanine-endopeptidase (penicillin-binding protein 4)
LPDPPAPQPAPATLAPPPAYDQRRLAALRVRLARLLATSVASRGTVSALVVEVSSGMVIFEREASRPVIPASNEKLFTTAASVALLGPDHRMVTRLAASAPPSPEGSVEALYLVGDHDLGWSGLDRDTPPEALASLARAAREQGIRRVKGALHVLGEPILEAQRFETLDPAAHRAKVARRFQQTLSAAGVAAPRALLSGSFALPTGAVMVGEARSEPLIKACATINQISHNEMADALLRHLGLARRGESTPQAGAAEVLAWLTSVGIPTTGLQVADGSGLSRDNRTTTRTLVALLETAARAPWGAAFAGTLAVAGEKGTLARRMTGPDTSGRLRGKTGTLEGVVSLSGYLQSRHDGRSYAFALVFNGVTKGAEARKVEDAFLGELASDWQGSAQ